MTNNFRWKHVFVIIAISIVFFMLGNGFLSLTNPDEVFYTQTAKEMLKYKTWLVPYLFDHPQFEKPVLTYWFLRIGFIFFGVSAFSARFFPALFAMIGAIAVYLLALLGYKDGKRAFICALVLASSGFYIGLARTVFTDMIFSIFILLSLLSFFWGYINTAKKARGITLCFIFSGLAVLTKGPLGLLIPMLAIVLFLVIRKDLRFLFSQYSLLGFLLFLVIAAPWYMLMIKKFGNSFVYEFFYNNHIRRILEAEHPGNDTWYFYPASMILPMFPWCIYVLVSFFYLFKRLKEKPPQAIYIYLASWIIAVFIIFEVVHSKLVSYIFPLFPALAIITGDFISNAILKKQKLIYVITLVTWFILLLLPIALAIGSAKYPIYFPSRIPVYYFIFLYYLIFLPVILLLIFRKKLWLAVYLLMVQVPLFLSFALTIHKGFEAYVSSRDACEYLLNNYKVKNTILCSKFLVRGVRYYTDKDVAVAKIGGPGLFSPHPIPYLDSDDEIRDFLKSQVITYCVLNRSSLIDIERIADGNNFKVEVLNTIGDENIIRVDTRPFDTNS